MRDEGRPFAEMLAACRTRLAALREAIGRPATAADAAALLDELSAEWNRLSVAAAALAQNESRFRTAAELAGALVYERDFLSGTAEFYDEVDSPMGYRPSEYPRTMEAWADLIHPDDLARSVEMARQSFAAGSPYVAPMRVRRKDGGYAVWLDRAKLLRDADGNPLKWRGVAVDISAQVEAEAAAFESRQRLADIIDFLPEATMVINVDGEVIAWNRAMERLSGVPAADMLGKGNYEYSVAIWGERRPMLIDLALRPDAAIEAKYAEFQRDGDSLSADFFVPRFRNGAGAYIAATAAVLRDPQGRVAGAVGCSRDVTERRLAEQRAQAADRAKSEFLATMSHELRTPLNAILGFAQVIRDRLAGELNSQQAQYVESILFSGRHLLRLINDVLDLSKIESGTMTLARAPMRIDDLLAGAVIMIRDRAASHGIDLALNLRPQVGARVIQADEHKLRQVLYNLLSNAVKFSPDGGSIAVGATQQDGEIIFSVADNGIGVNAANRSRIFEAFEQVDSGIARQHQGTGLGLALARRIVELHGGRIWVDSDGEGRGSTFSFAIPAG
jgi:PAS domain S-box-containing protein